MNLYHCMIELKNGAQALAFAAAADKWLGHLQARGLVGDWRLMRRKLGLGSDRHSDLMLEVEVESLAQLETAFHCLSAEMDDEQAQLYSHMHDMIARTDIALYRPYPDPSQRETIALI